MNALRKQQNSFAQFINDGVDGGVDRSFSDAIRENGLSGNRRLTIYQRNVAIGFCEALAGVYDVVRRLVGDDFFYHVAERYVRKYPSRTGNVHDFGSGFAEFLDGFPGTEALPYLPDVARLEWQYHLVFHSPSGERLNIERLSRVPESRYGDLHLLLSPACRLLSSEFPVLRIWQLNQAENEEDETVSLDEGGIHLVIVRHGKEVIFHSYEPAAFAMLDAISRSETFDQACEAALQVDPHCNVGQVLQETVLNRMIVGFAVNE